MPRFTGRLFIFSGAGLSKESGLDTFRDQGGLWEQHDVNAVCNIETWLDSYSLVHQFYNARRQGLATVEPNAAHFAINDLQTALGEDNVVSVTTNVDDLLDRAGVKNTLYLHGHLLEIRDLCGDGSAQNIGYTALDYQQAEHGRYKPNVIFFGEAAPAYQALSKMTAHQMQEGDLIVCIGMSFEVVPVDYLCPFEQPLPVININPDPQTHLCWPFRETFTGNAVEGMVWLKQEILGLTD